MRIVGATKVEIENALNIVNEMFEDNITFKSFTSANQKGTTWNVSLRAVKSDGPGARLAYSGRRSISACWHVHGYFMDALPSDCKIYSGLYGKSCRHPGEPWQEQRIGSQFMSISMSDLCECE